MLGRAVTSAPMAEIDHLVLAGRDVAEGVADLARRSGVECAVGGKHDGWGTHNSLASLGTAFLEIIGVDPDQPEPDQPRPFGIDEMTDDSGFRLVTAAIRPSAGQTAQQLVDIFTAHGFDPGPLDEAGRDKPDGTRLTWHLTSPSVLHLDGMVPFIIDWGDTPHPAESTPAGLSIESVVVAHPNSVGLAALFDEIGLDVRVTGSDSPAMGVTLNSPKGVVTL